MNQLTLINVETELDKRFAKFDEENPRVYEKLVRMSFDLKKTGHTKIGIGMLFEVIRWQSMLKTVGDDYKLNNSYRSRYARKIMEDYPELRGFFEIRELHS